MRNSGISLRRIALLGVVLTLLLGAPSSAHAITRSQVLRRAKVWTAVKVPYSQSRYATVEGSVLETTTVVAKTLGYRTDCSGFVSMALGLTYKSGAPMSLDTASLPTRLVKIPKAELLKGDVVLRPKNAIVDGRRVAYGHAVIFGGWADSAHKYYWGYHESSSAHGAVRSKIAWGKTGFYSEKGFAPYRYPSARYRARIDRKF